MLENVRNALERHPRIEWLILAVLCAVMLGQMLFSVSQMSQHADETTHLYAGYRVLKCSDYTFGREHPPLAKMLAAAPLLFSDLPVNCAPTEAGVSEEDLATRWLYSQDNWWPLLMRARIASSLAAVALFIGVWITARRMFGLAVAILSTAFLAFEPNILAHGALVLNNVLLAALFLFTVFSFYLWSRRHSVGQLIGTGVLLGLALLTKHSAVLLIPILILLALVDVWLESNNRKDASRRVLKNAGTVAAILVIAAATVWCGYGLRYSGSSREMSMWATEGWRVKADPASLQILKAARAAHLMPQSYLEGLIDVQGLVQDAGDGDAVLGRMYRQAPWFFFPLIMVVKFTLSFLAMLALGAAGLVLFGRERRRELLFLLIPALIYLLASLQVPRLAAGIWHLFPLVPFLLIAMSAGCIYFASQYRWAVPTLVCLLALHAVSSLRVYPNYLSYANEAWGGPRNLYKELPYTDLNQSFWEVSRYMDGHPNTPCWLDSNWSVPADKYNVHCVQMGNNWNLELPERMNGIVFVSSTLLQREGQPGDPLAPFVHLKPKALLGGSAVLVYEGEFDTRVLASRALDLKAIPMLNAGRVQEGLALTRRAVDFAPSSPHTHFWYCGALAVDDQPEAALAECAVARNLALAGPENPLALHVIEKQMKEIADHFGLPLPPQ